MLSVAGVRLCLQQLKTGEKAERGRSVPGPLPSLLSPNSWVIVVVIAGEITEAMGSEVS